MAQTKSNSNSNSSTASSSLPVLAQPVNIVNSTEYSHLNIRVTKPAIAHKKSKRIPVAPASLTNTTTTPKLASTQRTTKKKQNPKPLTQTRHKKKHMTHLISRIEDFSAIQTQQDEDSGTSSSTNTSSMPSPIPYMSPLHHESKNSSKKAASVSDSDYKTQSSNVTDNEVHSLTKTSSDEGPNVNHLTACEQMLGLEEKFIELMQKGVQQFSRPLRHCMMISAAQHHDIFQNIEKLLAISEYQLNQLISQDDSTLMDMFHTIGKLYENKMRMSGEAFDIYLSGIQRSFALLDALSTTNFAKFVAEAREDMDLRTFLLLPLYYVSEIHASLTNIRNGTAPDSDDYVCLNSLIAGLDLYVDKASAILKDQSKNPLRMTSSDLDETEFEFARVLYASESIQYRQSSHKWKHIQVALLSDKILLLSRRTDVAEFLREADTVEQRKGHFKSISLRSILNINFSLTNQFEFQVNYAKEDTPACMHSLKLRVNSLEEKLAWNEVFSKCLNERSMI